MAANSEKTASRGRGKGRPFQPGQSGNPSGRPKATPEQKDALAAIRDLAPEASSVLLSVMRDERSPAAARLRAVEIVLERTYGKAEASLRVDDGREVTLKNIRAEVEKIKAAVGGE